MTDLGPSRLISSASEPPTFGGVGTVIAATDLGLPAFPVHVTSPSLVSYGQQSAPLESVHFFRYNRSYNYER